MDSTHAANRDGFLRRSTHAAWACFPSVWNNPVILREMIASLRRPSAMIQLGIFLGLLGIVFLFIWHEALRNMERGYHSIEQARGLFMGLNMIAGAILLLFIPIQTASCINLERERDTWDLIRTTPLSLASIVFGKFFSAIGSVLLMLVALLPMYGMLFPLGGVSPGEIAFYLYMITETAVVVGLIGLLCSITCSQVVTSITATYVLGVIYIFGTMIIGLIAQGELHGVYEEVIAGFFWLLNPVMFTALMSFESGGPLNVPWRDYFPLIHGTQISLIILTLIGLCIWQLRREGKSALVQRITNRVSPSSSIAKSESPMPGKTDWSMRLLPEGRNPIVSREMRACFTSRLIPTTVGLASLNLFALIILGMISSNNYSDMDDYIVAFSMTVVCLVPLMVLPYGVNMIRGERDQYQWDLLATTTLTSWQILWGKMLAGLALFQMRFWAFYGICVAMLILVLLNKATGVKANTGVGIHGFWHDTNMLWTVGLAILLSTLAAFVMILYCAYVSLQIRKTVTAYIVSFLSLLFLYAGIPFLTMIVMEWSRSVYLERMIFLASSVLSPPMLMMSGITNSWIADGLFVRFIAFCGLYTLAALMLLRGCLFTIGRRSPRRDG